MKLTEIFMGESCPPRPFTSSGIHSLGPPALCARAQDPYVLSEWLLGSVKLPAESNSETL